MVRAACACLQASTQPGTIQAGAPVPSSTNIPPIRTPTSPATAPSPAPSTPPTASLAAATTSPPASVGPPASPSATSGSLDPQMSTRPSILNASDMCEYSTANVPEDVYEPALRWRAITASGTKTRRRRIKRHSSHARLGGGARDDGGGTASPSSGASPSPDMVMMQSAPSLRATLGRRASRRMASFASRNSRDEHSRRGVRVSMDGAAAADPEDLQVVVATSDITRASGGEVESAVQAPTAPPPPGMHACDSHKSISFGQAHTEPRAEPRGPDAVSTAARGARPLQADPGVSPFIPEDMAVPSTTGQRATPSGLPPPHPNGSAADTTQ